VKDRAQTTRALYRRFSGVIYEFCVRTLGDRAEAEDAMQETFVGVFRSLPGFRYGESHLPWIYRIATNVCLKLIHKRRRKLAIAADPTVRRVPDTPDPAGRVHAREVLESLASQLDDRGRQIFVAHYIAGMDQGQIARSLGISRRAVVKRLTRLRALAGRLDEEGRGDD
jgi:RNA polymerase sigma-70 factor (ECF subfamily)